jgi:hypothetical protein
MGVSFGQLLDEWLAECERLDLSPTALRAYRSQIERTIRPALGKLLLTWLIAKHLDDLYGAMKDAGKSPKTIRNHHAIIWSALHGGALRRRNTSGAPRRPRGDQGAPTSRAA